MTADTAVPTALAELADECGVATSYEDAHGIHRHVSARTLRAVLAALGVETTGSPDDDDERAASDRAALEEFRLRSWRRVLPPTVVTPEGSAVGFSVHVPRGGTVSVSVLLEDSDLPLPLHPLSSGQLSRMVDGVLVDRICFSVPDSLPIGWHRMVADVSIVHPDNARGAGDGDGGSGRGGDVDRCQNPAQHQVESTLLVYPATIPVPADLESRRAVGLATQLYQVRSERSWGMGDLSDLADMAQWAGRDLGADFVLVNPMHASEPFPPVSPSPYLPTSRTFSSPLYLRPEDIPEYAELPDADRARVDELARSAASANLVDSIERDASWTAKLEALRIVFTVPLADHRSESFTRFVEEQGDALSAFATWCAIAGQHGPDSSSWPPSLADPDSELVAEFAQDHSPEIRFHRWLQWSVAQQRRGAQARAVDAGMRLGVIHDLAVGVHPTGADAWALRRSLARGVTVGAPPDIYNQRGQDWSQPPLRPDGLAGQGYRPFRDIVRATLRDAGGLRIDHVLGLFRLWWIPSGLSPKEGTYVRYDHEAMLGVLAIEATRAGAMVVGEDLGTVAPGVREVLSDRGILGTSVMWFEQDSSGPIAPEDYRRLCMASVTTHDLPPTAGYANLVHVDIRDELGQLTGEVDTERSVAAKEIGAFSAAVSDRGLLQDVSAEGFVAALHGFVAATGSLLFAVSVSDLVCDRRPVNMPGTSDEYPNWRVPISDSSGALVSLETLRRLDAGGPVWRSAIR